MYPAIGNDERAQRFSVPSPGNDHPPIPIDTLKFEKPNPAQSERPPAPAFAQAQPPPAYHPPPQAQHAQLNMPSAPPLHDVSVRPELLERAPPAKKSWFGSFFSRSEEPATIKQAIAKNMPINAIKERFGTSSNKDVFGAFLAEQVTMDSLLKYGPWQVATLVTFQEAIHGLQLNASHFGDASQGLWSVMVFSYAFREPWCNVMSILKIPINRGKECGITSPVLRSVNLDIEQAARLQFDKSTIVRYELSPRDLKDIFSTTRWADLIRFFQLDSKDFKEMESIGWNQASIKASFPEYSGEAFVIIGPRQTGLKTPGKSPVAPK